MTGKATVRLPLIPTSALGSELTMPKLCFLVLASATKHTHGSGPSACSIWHMLNGLVGELRLRCRDTIARNILLLMTRCPALLI